MLHWARIPADREMNELDFNSPAQLMAVQDKVSLESREEVAWVGGRGLEFLWRFPPFSGAAGFLSKQLPDLLCGVRLAAE
jgi:hypothetical protein